MDRVVKGIVMEISKSSAVLMTSDGEFLKVKKPPKDITLGDEITSAIFTQVHKNHIIRYAGIAALILLLLIPFTYYKAAYATVAYINVDINPSLELGINKFNKVNDAVGLNSDGINLLKDNSLKGLDIKDALDEIIAKAKDNGYIDVNKDNNIEVALVKLNPGNVNVNEDSVMQYVKDAIVKTDVDAAIEVRSTDKKIYDNAKKENISTNKYLDKTQGNSGELREDVKNPNKPANSGSNENNNGKNSNGNTNNGSGNANNSGSNDNKGNSGKKEDNIKGQGDGPSYRNDNKNQSGSKMEEQDANSGNNSSQEGGNEDKPQQGNKEDQKVKK